ncbi:MAG: response regulator [Chloroflexi bacterium]|nr:response regulator [Chloroflexota bacterium]
MAESHILVVDDDPLNRMMLSFELEAEGHSIFTAEDGVQAMELLGSLAFDLVLLDVVMPRLDGFGVLAQMKDDSRLRDIPVIMISSLDELDSVVQGIELGAEDFLPKPCNSVLLRARIAACLDKKRLRDQEREYLLQVERVTSAAAAVEAGVFDLGSLDDVATRSDALGQLARVFQRMIREVAAREERLKQRLRETGYVFMSYASADRVRVLEIVDRLALEGMHVWVDRQDIPGGASYGPQIVQAIRGCSVMLVACSQAAMQSRNVKQEIQLAWKYQRPYLPLLLEPTSITDEVEYWLEGWQWVEVLSSADDVWLPQIISGLRRLGFGT